MKKTNRLIKGLMLALSTLSAGFVAIALPFRLFSTLGGNQVRWFFVLELALYFVITMVFIVAREKAKERKRKEAERRFQRRIKFETARKEYYDLAA